MRSRSAITAVAGVVLSLLLGAATSAAPYPTDVCVAAKLRAAAVACRDLVDAQGQDLLHPNLDQMPRARLRAEQTLTQAFQSAEAAASSAGVDCAEATATAPALAQQLDNASAVLGGDALRGLDPSSRPGDASLAFQRLRATARACADLLRAAGDHLERRSDDRNRTRLDRARTVALSQLRILLARIGRAGSGAGSLTETLVADVDGASRSAHDALTIAPAVSPGWTMIDPAASVAYEGRSLQPTCSDGSDWVFFARRGTVNKLVVYYQGGGACWDYLTCGAARTFKQTTGPGDNPSGARTGFANLNDPRNPFRDWNAVFVPYCTGDVHWGDATVTHTFVTNTVTIQHKGFINGKVAEKWAREHFVDPEQVFVTGTSAGAYGAILHSVYLQEGVYPSAHFDTLGDAGNGVITQDFLANDIAKWNVSANLPPWIPAVNVPLTQLSAADLWAEAARTYPRNRFATYTTAFDGGNGGQTGFYQIMRNRDDITRWFSWWNSSCAWNPEMRRLNFEIAGRAPGNFRYYVGTGSRHGMWGLDKVYTDTTGGVPTVQSWIDAMLGGTPAWTNTECTDCGLLLSGDPKPSAGTPPLSADGLRFVCPGTP